MADMRAVEIRQGDTWITIAWPDLKKGMTFRLREPNGHLADDGEVCVALEDVEVLPGTSRFGVKCDRAK